MAKPKEIPHTRDGYRKELMSLLRQNSHRHDLHNVWSDFVEMGAIAFSNAVDLRMRDEREARYMQIAGKYNADELSRFAGALGAFTMAMEMAEFDDVLGATFMELELGNKWTGQFFTPYSLSRMMGMINVNDDTKAIIDRVGYIKASDPCVGGGAMPIALAQAMYEAKLNPQTQLHVTAQDLDLKAVHMAYLQLTILNIPAVVIHGNSLQLEELSHWYTPAHILNGWTMKLRAKPVSNVEEIKPVSTIVLTHQTSLFEEAA
jgi:hypothetical protein